MFTGIIEEMGTVEKIKKVSEQAVSLTIGSKEVIKDVNIGDSVAVNGICLTVKQMSLKSFEVDAMPETIRSTSLQALKPGAKVNLERAMMANGRFGGHFVSGHVDGTGSIIDKRKKENAIYYDIEIKEALAGFLMYKGSITVDGISLTVFGVSGNVFTISLIPHTVYETVLGEKGKGDIVNIECDLLAKHVKHMLQIPNEADQEGVNEDLLRTAGFM
ncbi:riboflavin synthase [Oceanobacillus massiliensis]|uniref:riboflavin synthase n=1 Tax=Oceanobacillus massiliensis TaxID=1465765 RepID=UPI0002885EA4|nr:riboflavin synthase [Oceanobacillus massiliensis]